MITQIELGVQRHFQQYVIYIVAFSFIGGGNRSTQRKPLTSIGQNFKVLQIIVIWGFVFLLSSEHDLN